MGNDVIRKAAAAAALGALLLASTACGPNGGDGPGDPKPSDRPSATGSPQASATSSPKASATASAKPGGGSGSPGGGAGNGGGATVAACAVEDLAFSVTSEDGEGKSIRHLLITVTNTGKKKCKVYQYPY
ncbi:DUF4232 domain-containing protein, partial [Streptomyces sp. NPDC091371]|uniref:DUF4232 domain-containing protein n=1 Tax=Streptomyces sp. NPDC091371 TaxID=3155303 RepID=UPI003419EEAC